MPYKYKNTDITEMISTGNATFVNYINFKYNPTTSNYDSLDPNCGIVNRYLRDSKGLLSKGIQVPSRVVTTKGLVNIPTPLFEQMRKSKRYFLDIPFAERLQFIVSGYGKFEKNQLMSAILRIKKRLGGLETKTAINYLIEDDIINSFSVLLTYYDKLYLKGAYNRENPESLIHKIEVPNVDPLANASNLLAIAGLQ